MKIKYMILAIAPILFQGTLYCDDINQMIMPQLQSSQKLMKSTKIALELQSILDALVSFAQKSKDTASAAVDQMKSIKAALSHYREEEQKAWSQGSKTWWDSLLGRNPKKVIEEIDPAITKVNNALKTLGANSSKLGYTIAASAAGAVAAASIAVLAVWLMNVPADETTNDVANRLRGAMKTAEAAYNDADYATKEAVKNANLIDESSSFYSKACDAASSAALALGEAALALSDTNDAARRSDVLSAEAFAAETRAAANRANAARILTAKILAAAA